MKVLSAANPKWVDAEHAMIGLDVKFEELSDLGVIPFSAYKLDVEEHGRDLFNRAAAGEFGEVAEYVVPEETITSKIISIKDSVTNALNAKAKELGFDDFADALTYCDEDSVPSYQIKAKKLRAWRSVLRAWSDELEATVTQKTVVSEALVKMPAFEQGA